MKLVTDEDVRKVRRAFAKDPDGRLLTPFEVEALARLIAPLIVERCAQAVEAANDHGGEGWAGKEQVHMMHVLQEQYADAIRALATDDHKETPPPAITKHEYEVLEMLAGTREPKWGAAVGACLEFLAEGGYCTRGPNYQITDKGRRALVKEGEE